LPSRPAPTPLLQGIVRPVPAVTRRQLPASRRRLKKLVMSFTAETMVTMRSKILSTSASSVEPGFHAVSQGRRERSRTRSRMSDMPAASQARHRRLESVELFF
jgi:hypothetical protein